MHVTNPYEGPYAYGGESVAVEAQLTREQHHACFEAAGIPPAGYDPQARYFEIEPPDDHWAARLRAHLRQHRIAHTSELCVTYRPEETAVREFEEIRTLAASAPLPPELLGDLARHQIATEPDDDRGERLLAFLHRRLGSAELRSRIERGQRDERDVSELFEQVAALPEGALDEAVHDAHSADASGVNNCGPEEQLRYLIARDFRGAAIDAIQEAGC